MESLIKKVEEGREHEAATNPPKVQNEGKRELKGENQENFDTVDIDKETGGQADKEGPDSNELIAGKKTACTIGDPATRVNREKSSKRGEKVQRKREQGRANFA